MQDLDPENPWVKDPSGKHTNVSALLDWPEESDDSDNESSIAPSSQMNSSFDGTSLELYTHDEGNDQGEQQATGPPGELGFNILPEQFCWQYTNLCQFSCTC